MNHFNENEHKLHIDEPWMNVAVEQLRQPLESSVAARLKVARRKALDQQASKFTLPSFFIWGVPTLACVFAIMLSVGFWQKTDTDIPLLQTADNVDLEDFSIIKASDDLEFYQNLEFLLWMEQADNGLTKG